VEALPESIQVQQSFLCSSSVECRSYARIFQILIENWLSSPSSVLVSWLVGIVLQHYIGVGDLPIIVSHSFAALLLFMHLHTI
jgi:hypothetical protein